MSQPASHDPDLPLIQAIRAGDGHALRLLYERHGAGILSFLRDRLHDHQGAEEVLQDVMLAVWKSAATFRGESKVRTWLLTIARRHAIDAYHRHPPPALEFHESVPDPANVTAAVEQRLLHETLTDVFKDLTGEHREVVKLIFYHGLTCAEAAEVLDVPVGTVKSRLHHARQAMRRLLQIKGIDHA